jgi:hypothetical protein
MRGALRDSLVRAGAEDQAGRDSIAIAIASKDTAYVHRLAHNDSSLTQWLERVIAAHGWPRRSQFGDSAAGAAWLIVQHSPMREFQEKMLPILQVESKRGEVNAPDVAMLADRVYVQRGEPQRYGTQFSIRKDRLAPDSIVVTPALDSLRASVGLPPMAEYVHLLAQMYKMPVEWPPSSGKLVRP